MFEAGALVLLLPFPFSDATTTKRRHKQIHQA
jgi:hypothetical protein